MEFLRIFLILGLCTTLISAQNSNAFKRPMGDTIHDVAGDKVELVDTRTIKLKNLRYDGKGPRTFFVVGKGDLPTQNVGFDKHPAPKIPDEKKRCDTLLEYKTVDIELKLPSDYKQGWSEIKWVGLYCFKAKSLFAYQEIPPIPAGLTDGGPGEKGCDNPLSDESDKKDGNADAPVRAGPQLSLLIIGLSLLAARFT